MDETIAHLRTLPYVDGAHIGVAGFCMSDRIALSYATERDPEAVALFHGGLYTHDFDDVFAGRWDAGRAIWRFGADSSVDYDLASLRNRDAGGGQKRLA